MIRYQKFQSKAQNATNGMWYLRSVSDETIDLEQLAKHMAAHNTPYSAGTVHGVLKDMVACIKELVLDGKKVKLADLAIFYASISSKGSKTLEDLSVDRNVKNVHLVARATGSLRSRILTSEARKAQLREYTAPAAKED